MKTVGRRAFMFALVLLTLLMPYSHAGASFRHKSETIIDGGSGNAYRTDIAFDGLGNAIAVFEQKTADGYRLYANHYSTKEGWSGPLMIDAGVGDAYRGKVAANKATGAAIAVFKQKTRDGLAIYARMYSLGSGWNEPVRVSAMTKDSDGAAVVFGPSGNAVAVFEQLEGDSYKIYANIYDPSRGWLGPVKVSRGGNSAYFPAPVFDGKGDIHVAYYEEAPAGLEIVMSRYDTGKGAWDEPARLPTAASESARENWKLKKSRVLGYPEHGENPSLSDDIHTKIYSGADNLQPYSPSGIDGRLRDAYTPSLVVTDDAVAAYFAGWDGRNMRAYAARYGARGWEGLERIDAGSDDIEHIRASLNSKGEVAVVYSQWVKNTLRVHGRLHAPGKGWQGTARIIDAFESDAYAPSIVSTDDGGFMVVWCQRADDTVKSFVSIYRDGRWAKAQTVEEFGFTCGVRIASGPNGAVIVIYEQTQFIADDQHVNRIHAVAGNTSQSPM